MPLSGYQVEWLIYQQKRWRGLQEMVRRALHAPPDTVQLSAQSKAQSPQHPAEGLQSGEPFPLPRPSALADAHLYPAAVAHQLERRAGSFMRPRHAPAPPSRIARVPLRSRRKPPAKP